MILKLFFWFISWRIKRRLKSKPQVQALLQEENFSVQISTACGSFSRYFQIAAGEFSSLSGHHPNPSISVSFDDKKIAWKVLKAVRKDKAQIFTAIQNKEISVEGDFSILQKVFEIRESLQAA